VSLKISHSVRAKLGNKNPPVTREEIEACFANRSGTYLEDTREQHKTDPPTKWFIAETFYGRKLKIAFIQKGANTIIRTAYDPNKDELRIFNKYSTKT
jgi:hypothetical protein